MHAKDQLEDELMEDIEAHQGAKVAKQEKHVYHLQLLMRTSWRQMPDLKRMTKEHTEASAFPVMNGRKITDKSTKLVLLYNVK